MLNKYYHENEVNTVTCNCSEHKVHHVIFIHENIFYRNPDLNASLVSDKTIACIRIRVRVHVRSTIHDRRAMIIKCRIPKIMYLQKNN